MALSRLDAVKRVASAFVAARRGDRIGLVVFGERPYVAQPPTFDVASVAHSIETAQIGISGRGTAIADGLGLAVRRLEKSKAATRIIVLLSDGVDTSGKVRADDVARLAARHGIKVHTIALGPEDLETQPRARDAVDAAALKAIAEIGGGTGFTLSAWVYRTRQGNEWDRIIDFGSGPSADNVLVAFTNFLFAGAIQPMFGDVMGPYAGAFFYVLTVMVERCEYSCGFMNPAVVLATHAWDGDLTSAASMMECATYFIGAMGGAAAVAGVNALAKPRKAAGAEKKKEL